MKFPVRPKDFRKWCDKHLGIYSTNLYVRCVKIEELTKGYESSEEEIIQGQGKTSGKCNEMLMLQDKWDFTGCRAERHLVAGTESCMKW